MNRKINLSQISLAIVLLLIVSVACSSRPGRIGNPSMIHEEAPVIITSPPPSTAYDTQAILEQTELPQRDFVALAQRLRQAGEIPRVVRDAPHAYEIGDEELFWASNVDSNDHSQIPAILHYITPHLYVWVEQGAQADMDALRASADRFEEQTYPTNRRYFGSEWSPGIDGDDHLNILHATNLGDTVAGFYSSSDEFSHLAHEYSNEREMFYINLDGVAIGSEYYDGVLAHEFQHMIHWHMDRNEDLWLNEGFSELASYLNGFDHGSSDALLFLSHPDLQLTHFSYGDANSSAHYGAAYLFTLYFLDRFGEEATRALVAHPANGPAGINAVLSQLNEPLDFATLFADWAVALFLDDTTLSDGRYGFQSIDLDRPGLAAEYSSYPVSATEATVHQFASDYLRLTGTSPVTVVFTGTQQVPLVGTTPHGGTFQWWSNRGDDADTTLTRAFDFSGLETVTCDYWLWYDIEKDWDYAYLQVSTDGGRTWNIIQTPHTTGKDPTGNNYGYGYTGMSGNDSDPQWIHETIDLSAYARQSILLRFEYITDGAINRAGLVLDDFSIPELNYQDGFEIDDSEWKTAGFVRSDNVLPQKFIVQLIELGAKPLVRQLPLNKQKAEWQIPLDDETSEAILIISGLCPVTLETASYAYQIVPGQ